MVSRRHPSDRIAFTAVAMERAGGSQGLSRSPLVVVVVVVVVVVGSKRALMDDARSRASPGSWQLAEP